MPFFASKWKWVLAVVLVYSASAWAADQLVVADFSSAVGASGPPARWEVKEKSGKADFSFVKDDGIAALRLVSANTSFSLEKEVHVNLKQYPGNGR